MIKSPFSSVTPCAKVDILFCPLVWHVTDTEAPAGKLKTPLQNTVHHVIKLAGNKIIAYKGNHDISRLLKPSRGENGESDKLIKPLNQQTFESLEMHKVMK